MSLSCAVDAGIFNKRLYTTTYTYEPGRDGLLEVKNWLNVTRNTANGVVQPERRASIHTYTLNALGQRTSHREDMSQYYNGTTSAYDRDVTRTFGYDTMGQLLGATAAYNNTGSLFLGQSFSEMEHYSYDAIGNRSHAIKPKPVLNAGWVTQTLPPVGDNLFYDSAATNACTGVCKLLAFNPWTVSSSTLKYDADGNLISDGKYQYTWDGENRLIAMSPVPGTEYQGEGRYFYSYDYMGRRVTRTVDFRIGSSWAPKQKNTFVFDGWNVIGDFHTELAYNPAWTTLRCDRYVWGQDVSGSLQGAGGVGGLLLGVTQPSEIGLMANMGYTQAFCFLYDANGNVTDTVNEGGGIMGQYRYDGFGNLLGQTRTIGIRQTGVVQGLIDQPFGFSTKWVDSTDVMPLLYAPNANHRTLAYYGYRHYAPQLGRWINRDPIEEQGGLNLYGMVGNDPVGTVDVLGLQAAGCNKLVMIGGTSLSNDKPPHDQNPANFLNTGMRNANALGKSCLKDDGSCKCKVYVFIYRPAYLRRYAEDSRKEASGIELPNPKVEIDKDPFTHSPGRRCRIDPPLGPDLVGEILGFGSEARPGAKCVVVQFVNSAQDMAAEVNSLQSESIDKGMYFGHSNGKQLFIEYGSYRPNSDIDGDGQVTTDRERDGNDGSLTGNAKSTEMLKVNQISSSIWAPGATFEHWGCFGGSAGGFCAQAAKEWGIPAQGSPDRTQYHQSGQAGPNKPMNPEAPGGINVFQPDGSVKILPP